MTWKTPAEKSRRIKEEEGGENDGICSFRENI
jgi:hypothetical protein